MTHKRLVVFTVGAALLLAGVGGARVVRASDPGYPSADQIASAQATMGFLVNELVSALFAEFKETTPDNADQGKRAISLVFNNLNRDMRLIGDFYPLLGGDNDLPSGDFETAALNNAINGDHQPTNTVEKIDDTWYYRLAIPLNTSLAGAAQNPGACLTCHKNFTSNDQWVGSLVLRVPIKSNGANCQDRTTPGCENPVDHR